MIQTQRQTRTQVTLGITMPPAEWTQVAAKLMDNRTTRLLALKIRDVIEPSEWQCQNGCGVFESAEEETLP